MHALHDYLCHQLEDLLRERSVVVFYDARREFEPFFRELSDAGTEIGNLRHVPIGSLTATLAEYTGSFFQLRGEVEELVGQDRPEPLVLYVPGVARDPENSVLMELELGGKRYDQPLNRLALNILRKSFSDGQIDELLHPGSTTYEDIVSFLKQAEEGETASTLRGLFGGLRSEPLIAEWLVSDQHDDAIAAKGATPELLKLIESRIGLVLAPVTSLVEARERTTRYVLVGDFRTDLSEEPPQAIAFVPETQTKEHRARVADVSQRLRNDQPDRYVTLADTVERELGLGDAQLSPSQLGTVDTFRFEEKRLLEHVGERITAKEYGEALDVISARRRSFWVDRDVTRQAQWEASRLMTALGIAIEAARIELPRLGSDPTAWVEAYIADHGWHETDRLHRSLETWIAKMDEEPESEQALAVIRREQEELLKLMADGFGKAFRTAGWTVPNVLHQTSIYSQVVEPLPVPVAYFFIDAMRFEMGAELAQQLEGAGELSLRPAIAALPSITPVGMAALLPGASSSFSVVEGRGQLASRIAGTTMPGITERMKYLKARVPGLRDLTLDDVLRRPASELRRRVDQTPLVIVRSDEIDSLGENVQDLTARAAMERVIGNIARAVRKLADAGIERFVITADHGHQFSIRKEEDMRMDNPGGATLESHRRCWIGRGGATPPGAERVSGAELGYDTDLEFVFPSGLGVFKAGGGLSFHHGGHSLQELVIPVVSLRIAVEPTRPFGATRVRLDDLPERITNRMFVISLVSSGDLFESESQSLRVVLVSENEQVGQAGMVTGADLDRLKNELRVAPSTAASVGMMLTRDDISSLRVVVQDSHTDAVLYQSEVIPVQLGI